MCSLSNIHSVVGDIYFSHCLQAIPVANTSLTMELKLGYESEFSHLQINPDPFPLHLSRYSWFEQWPCPQDKQLQSSSQFILSTIGNVKLSKRTAPMLSGSNLANCTPVISVMLLESYLALRQESTSLEHSPNVQCSASISPAYENICKFWNIDSLKDGK